MASQIKIDSTDRIILKMQLKDARVSIKKIAEECGISSSAVLKRIENLKSTGLIIGSELRLKQGTFGYSQKATIGIIANISKIDEIAKTIRDIPNVVVCAKSIGKYNVFCLLVAKNIVELDNVTRIIKQIAGVKEIAINIWIDQYLCFENAIASLDE